MKLAIIGKGTAGSVVAAYLKNKIKDIEIDLYYSRDIATIGVGEGGGPRLGYFLDDLGINHHEFCLKTNATKKWGILFEDWGSTQNQTVHHFHPARERFSYHFDASQLHDILVSSEEINIIEGRIDEVSKAVFGTGRPSLTCNGHVISYDYIIDATGFMKKQAIGEDRVDPRSGNRKSLLLANQAYLVQTRSSSLDPYRYTVSEHKYDSLTLSKALRHGWMFVIPLRHRVSYGYIHNKELSKAEEIQEELHNEINKIDPLHTVITTRTLSFESFTSDRFLDGSVFSIGNRAAFAEPLEATAIEFILRECGEIEEILSKSQLYEGLDKESQEEIFNRRLNEEMQRIALFIGWHYSNGSIHDSDFWKQSREHYKYMRQTLIGDSIVAEFDEWLSTLNYTGSCPNRPFFGWSLRSFEEVSVAIT
jgi:tryptophan halogenase